MDKSKAPINARIDAQAIRALKQEAHRRQMTLTELLEKIITEHQAIEGPSGAQQKIIDLLAVIAEQERRLLKATGRKTPSKKRISLTISHAAAQKLEREARRAGKTKSELIDSVIMPANMPAIKQPTPALTNG